MSISLPPELGQFVENEISSGRFGSEDEVICEAIRLLRALNMRKLRKQLRVGIEQIEKGEETVIEGDEQLAAFFDEIENEVHCELASAREQAE